MIYGQNFRVIGDFRTLYIKITVHGNDECFYAKNRNGILDYCIIDDRMGQPSLSNYADTDHAKLLRAKANLILIDLLNQKLIEPMED
jgi:hypothetical protein